MNNLITKHFSHYVFSKMIQLKNKKYLFEILENNRGKKILKLGQGDRGNEVWNNLFLFEDDLDLILSNLMELKVIIEDK